MGYWLDSKVALSTHSLAPSRRASLVGAVRYRNVCVGECQSGIVGYTAAPPAMQISYSVDLLSPSLQIGLRLGAVESTGTRQRDDENHIHSFHTLDMCPDGLGLESTLYYPAGPVANKACG